MNFLNPIWLFALAAISIPVVIHLWNIKPGKTLKVGSIALFSESSAKSSRSFKLLDILLLVLRCLLLALIAFLLATPLWQAHLKAGKAKGWVLIPKENYNQTYKRFKLSIDSATKQGYELHYFNKGFAKIDSEQLQKHPLTDSASIPPANYWYLVKQLQHQIPASVKVEIFTPNPINHFSGTKPDNGLNINWHTYTPADSVITWLAGAWLTTAGNIRVMQGTATPAGTNYQYTDIKNGGQAGSAYNVTVVDGIPTVSLNNEKIEADTTAQHIAIFDDKNATDAGYLKAALNAIELLSQRKTIINIYHQPEAIPGNQDWIYWLSDQQPDNSIKQKTRNILVYQSGKITEVNTWISNSSNYTMAQSQAKISLIKVVSAPAIGNAIWTDGSGNPVLSLEQDKTNTYYFYSRFNPAWGDLVWSDEFPKWLLVLTVNSAGVNLHDKRAIDNKQLVFNKTSGIENTIHATPTYTDLSKYVWLVLAVIFLTERWLATKNKTVLANG